ncbi:MAG: UDP-glucose/GDP-mannose dehydrogenase family protein [Vicinamibacterales bacterium]
MRVSIVGTGYVGLVTGACLSEKGHEVTCVDIDPDRVAALNRAESPIFEAGLDSLLRANVGRGLRATTDLRAAVLESDLTLIAVGTPFNGQEIDLTAVLGATRQIGEVIRDKGSYHLVVVKSTVVPGTTDKRVLPLLESASGKKAGQDFGVGVNPEFLSEGEAVNDFLFPDRIVLGGIDSRSVELLERLYESFPDVPRVRTNTRTAEMIKYASNALLAALISFSNELANLGAAIGDIDTVDVMHGLRLSQYFRGRNSEGLPPITAFLAAGCGFGGSCLPKDVGALVAHGRSVGQSMRLLDAVLQINKEQPQRVIELLTKRWPRLSGVRVAVLGLAFKPETSDVRESPAFPIMRQLLERGAEVRAYDPVARYEAEKAFPDPGVRYCASLDTAIADVDAVVVVTPWEEFQEVPSRLNGRGRDILFVDSRRTFPKDIMPGYVGIGL